MAITTLAAWAGLAVTPLSILKNNDFNDDTIMFAGFLLGLVLIAAGYFSQKKRIKSHFEFTYSNFGAHLLFISVLAAIFHFDAIYLLFFILLIAAGYFFYIKAIKEKSFYFLLILSLYLYIGLSYSIVRIIFVNGEMGIAGVYLTCMYFILSAVGLILFLIKMNKKIKSL
jgi:hypothetical protein